MRRTEDISFDYNKNKNIDITQKNKYHKKESFVIDVKEIKKKEQKQKVERPATVKVAKGPWEIVYEWMDSFVFSIILILFVFVFCFRVVGVDGESMMPTLNHGDWLTVKAINTEITRGDIVVITQPNSLNEPLIKRVIAVGGDTLDIDFVTGSVEVNGEVIDEPYIMEQTRNKGDFDKPIRIPDGYVFVMGDNRNNSLDSRFDSIGIIDERYILGVANARMYPFGEWEIY
jgi:signal peptidase I